MDPVRRLAELNGAARRSDLVGSQSQGRALARAVERGEIVKHAGCYALPGAPEWIIRARQFRGLLTCVSWAQEAGLAVLERPAAVHLAIPRNRGVKRCDQRPRRAVVLHRTSTVDAGRTSEPPVTLPAVSAARMLVCLDPLAAIVTIDSVLHRGICSPSEIRSWLGVPGRGKALATLQQCDGRSESVLESVARVVLRAAGLDARANVWVPGVGRVDLLVEGWVVVELDGFEHHGTRRAFGEDRRRDRLLTARGYRVLRFTYEDVLRAPQEVVLAVRAALTAPLRLG